MRHDLEGVGAEPCVHEQISNGGGPLEAQLEIRLGRSRRIRVSDDNNVGDDSFGDGLQDLRDESSRLFGQLVGLESEMQGKASGWRRQGR